MNVNPEYGNEEFEKTTARFRQDGCGIGKMIFMR